MSIITQYVGTKLNYLDHALDIEFNKSMHL